MADKKEDSLRKLEAVLIGAALVVIAVVYLLRELASRS